MNSALTIGQSFSDTLTAANPVDVLTVNLSANITYEFNLTSSGPTSFSISSVGYPSPAFVSQGLQAIQNSYAARGLGVSGAAALAEAQYLINPGQNAVVNATTYTPTVSGVYTLAIDSWRVMNPATPVSTAVSYSLNATTTGLLPPPAVPHGPGLLLPPPPAVPHGPHKQYIVTNDNGTLHVEDAVGGQDEAQAIASGNLLTFSDGMGLFDPTGTAENVDLLYSAALGRAPDIAGLQFWTSNVDDSHISLSDVANSFAASPEFISHYGSLSDAAFVQQLYQNVLDRPGEAGGVQFWQNALATGTSRGGVLLGFAESPENQAKTLPTAGDKNNAEAYRLYQAALDRTPDQGGQTFWSSQLKAGANPDQLAQNFISSPEFQQKYGSLSASDFVSQLYQNVLHRAGDPAGQQAWTTQLQGGASQASVLVGFSDSPENRVQTANATHDGWVFIHA
jgi:Domain of unknown function (DUF4214)